MGLRKHGVGEIIDEPEISKESSKQEGWDESDEQALADEE